MPDCNRMYRAAIIGCGQIGGGYDDPTSTDISTHAHAYHQHKDVTLVAAVDPDQPCGAAFARKWDCPEMFADVEEMLAHIQPEIVSICSPDTLHAQHLEQCLNHNSVLGVWCEKPIAHSPEAANRIEALLANTNRAVLVNYQRHWAPEIASIKKEIESGRYGEIHTAIVHYTKGVLHNGSHALSLLLDWFSFPENTQVFARIVDFTPDDPTVTAHLRMGQTDVMLLGGNENDYSIFEIDLIGTRGRVLLDNFGLRISRYEVDTKRVLNLTEAKSTGLDRAMLVALDDLVQQVEHANDAITSGKASTPRKNNGASSAMRAIQVFRACDLLRKHT